MTWWNKDYRRRQAITIDATGGTGIPAVIDFEVRIPEDWDGFWDNVRSDLYDIVVTDAKGNLVNFSRKAGASYATRTLTLQVDAYSIQNANTVSLAYVYFAYANEATDRSVATTITTPKNGYILLSAPHSRLITINNAENAVEIPAQTFIKAEQERIHVFYIFNRFLAARIEDYNEHADEEGVDYVTISSLDSSGLDDPTRYLANQTRFGNGFVRATFIGGNASTDYAIVCRFYTTLGQVLEARALLRVKDLLP
jgi:hypothetical protein